MRLNVACLKNEVNLMWWKSNQPKSFIDEESGHIVLYQKNIDETWTLTNDVLKIYNGKEERTTTILISDLEEVELDVTFFLGTHIRISGSGYLDCLVYAQADEDVAKEFQKRVSRIIVASSESSPSGHTARSYIDENSGDIFLRSHDFTPDYTGRFLSRPVEWIISGTTITVIEHHATKPTRKVLQITQLSQVEVESSRINLFIGSGVTRGTVKGTTLALTDKALPHHTLKFNPKDIEVVQKAQEYISNYTSNPSSSASQVAPAQSVADELLKLKGLVDADIITQEEFEHKKRILLKM